MRKISNVFYITIGLIVLAVGYGVLAPESFAELTGNVQSWVAAGFGWYYLMLLSGLVLICLFLIFSPFGKIKLGKDTDEPEFSTISWIAMLFSAGMGIGLVFYGAAEPLSHFAVMSYTADLNSAAAFKEGLRESFFHWGIHVWAMYGFVALSLAFFQFRKGEPGLISSTLKPIFGDKMKGYYTEEANVVGVESRTSSPISIPRNERLEHPQISNLYPCGEGPGYAGGIVSAAIDGERCAESACGV